MLSGDSEYQPQTQKPETQAISKIYTAAHKTKTGESNSLLDTVTTDSGEATATRCHHHD